MNATVSLTDELANNATESDNGLSLPQSNVAIADAALANEQLDNAADTMGTVSIAMTNIGNVPTAVTVDPKPLLLKPGKTVLLFYSSAAKKAYRPLSP